MATPASRNLPVIEVQQETETVRGWSYVVRIDRAGVPDTEHLVTLSWADHEYWCGGMLPPSKLIESILRFLASRESERPIPARFDASTARRWFPDLDEHVRIGRVHD